MQKPPRPTYQPSFYFVIQEGHAEPRVGSPPTIYEEGLEVFTLEVEGLEPLSLRFEKAFSQMPSDIQAVLEETANNTVERAKALAATRLKNPGTYLDSFYVSAAKLEVMFGNTHRAARIIEMGSSPHVIEPRSRKALRFETEGGVVFAKRALHPGTQSLWILSDAFQEELVELTNRLQEAAKIQV